MTFTLNDFSPLDVQIIATAFVIWWFEFAWGHHKLKTLLFPKYKNKYKKPFDCRLCNHFWIGSLFGILFIFTEQLENGLIYLALNFVTSYYYDKIQNGAFGKRPSEDTRENRKVEG